MPKNGKEEMKKDTKNDKNQKKKEKELAKAKEPYNSTPHKDG